MAKLYTLYSLKSHALIHPERYIVLEQDAADSAWWLDHAQLSVIQSCSADSWTEARDRMAEDQWL